MDYLRLTLTGCVLLIMPVFGSLKRDFPVRNLLLDNFQISANRIIRTQDSRILGADFVNETDRQSNEDCLRWCFEMEKCNVAVYEEKNRGSCYLFDCGTSDNFRCKFTTHTFYTSSILKMDRDSQDFSQWQSQVKHENELASLRHSTTLLMPETTHKMEIATPPATTQLPIITSQVASSSEPACQHYQFACRRSKECIAIYNVCDGIPQCPDGSDESKDLHCPGTDGRTSTVAPPLSSARPSPLSAMVPVENANRPPAYSYQKPPPADGDQKMQRVPSAQQKWTHSNIMQQPEEYGPREGEAYASGYGPQHIFSNKHSNFVAANVPYHSGGNAYNSGQWVPADYYNEPYEGHEQEYNRYHNYGSYHRPETKPPTAFDHYKRPVHYWPQEEPKYAPKNEDDPRKNQWLMPPRQEAPDTYPLRYNADTVSPSAAAPPHDHALNPPPRKSISTVPVDDGVNAYQPDRDSRQRTHPPPTEKPAETSTEASTTTTSNPRPAPGRGAPSYAHRIAAEDGAPSISDLQQAGRIHSHESNSAVLALTLGLCVTALLLVLVGCRMKSIRKRLARRGRSSLAHDADYLVNGMYL